MIDGLNVDLAGNKEWFKDGKYHREDGPALEYVGSSLKVWYINGILHRIDGPAMTTIDAKWYYVNDKLHREDGPAFERQDGYKEWWFNNEQILVSSNEEFLRIVKLKAFL